MPLFGPPNVQRLKANSDVKGLVSALGYQKDCDVRKTAAEALGQIGDARAIDPLIVALSDDDYFVPGIAAIALGRIRDPRAIEPLIKALSHPTCSVREAAAEALGIIGDKSAVEPLIEALNDIGDVVSIAINSLLAIGDERAIVPIIFYSFSGDLPEDYKVISKGLEQFSDEQKLEPLLKALWGEPPSQWSHNNECHSKLHIRAIQELAKIRDDRALQALIKVLTDSKKYMRINAAKALGEVGEVSAVGPLTELLKDGDMRVREVAREALEKIGKKQPS